MMWHHWLYLASAISNVGPASVYLTIMVLTVRGLELPRWGNIGAKNFFFGCMSTHVLMVLMMIVMLALMGHDHRAMLVIAALMFLVNIQQTIGAFVVIYVVANRNLRAIRLRPSEATERVRGPKDD